jgi:flagellar biosynthesis protein FlhB
MAEDSNKDDKTEEPTLRRLEQAVERGDVAKSQELNSLFVLAGGALCVMLAGGVLSRDLAIAMRGFFEHAHQIQLHGDGLTAVFKHALMAALWALALPLFMLMLAGVGANMMQHKFVFSTEQLMPQFSRINPLSGFARIFGTTALANFIKGLIKISLVGTVIWVVMRSEHDRLDAITRMDPSRMLPLAQMLVVKLFGAVLAIYAFVALGDYIYQRYTWYQRQRMTREELKQEFKDTDGNPEIKQKLKQIRNQRARRRMMAAVPKASVIITNPTHYAIALKYEKGMAAPVCVAKGVDLMALKIREVAGEHRVPIVENPPLARALHKVVEIDDEVPEEHYRAVAEVIGMVLRLRKRAG